MLSSIHKNASEFCECFCSLLCFLPFFAACFSLSVLLLEFFGGIFFCWRFQTFKLWTENFCWWVSWVFVDIRSTWSFFRLFGFKSFLLVNCLLGFCVRSCFFSYFNLFCTLILRHGRCFCSSREDFCGGFCYTGTNNRWLDEISCWPCEWKNFDENSCLDKQLKPSWNLSILFHQFIVNEN